MADGLHSVNATPLKVLTKRALFAQGEDGEEFPLGGNQLFPCPGTLARLKSGEAGNSVGNRKAAENYAQRCEISILFYA